MISSDPFKVLHKKYRNTNCGLYTLDKDVELVDLINDCPLVQRIDYDVNEKIFFDAKFSLILIPGVFEDHYSQDLFSQLLYELPKKHSILKSNVDLPAQDIDSIQESNLRWLTFGYHYDWTNKIYTKDDHHETPSLLDELINCLTGLLRLNLKAEAGIVNYYTCKSKLNPHSDCREENLSAPLLSISLGEKAVFLIGQHRYETQVTPLILRNGDIMIMDQESRLAYHSISRIVCDDDECKKKLIKRINLNIRQVY